MPPPPRAPPDEVIEEILLRLPPHKPACLVRASLASKRWLARLSGARFRGLYREFHGAPPMLGFLQSWPWDFRKPSKGDPVPPFYSTTKFHPRIPDSGWGHRDYSVWDCRHGRVLLGEKNAVPMKLAIWDPMTGHRRELQEPGCMASEHKSSGHLAAAVVCAVSGCDHRACHEGPFRVVFFSLHHALWPDADFVAQACMSLPETCDRSDFDGGEWGEPSSGLPIDSAAFIEPRPPVLVKDAIHFMLAFEVYDDDVYDDDNIARVQVLKYDMSSNSLSLIDAPWAARHFGDSRLMAMEDGSLGFVREKRLHLYIWSRQMGSDGVTAWTRPRVINLQNIPPIKGPQKSYSLLGSVEGSDIIFVTTELGIYKINLKTLKRKKISENILEEQCFNALIPYMSFYNPREMVRAPAIGIVDNEYA